MNIGQWSNEADAISAGYQQIPIKVLLSRILGNTGYGDYLYGFRFVSTVDQDGRMEGTNNVGSYNTGRWTVDETANTFSVEWDQSWATSTTRAYSIGEEIHFFDADTGLWRMSFTEVVQGKQPLEVR